MISIALLGPVAVHDGERDLTPGPAKHRALLAGLALNVGSLTTVERLVAVIWGDAPPRSAESVLRVYVSALRRLLGADLIKTVPGGYQLLADPEQVDVWRFEQLLGQARQCAPDQPAAASALLADALALWRGEPVADLDSDELRRGDAARLTELRLAAIAERIDLDLRIGRHQELTGELRRLVAEQPLRERAWAQLVIALHRSGRRSEALATYQQARQTLVTELGLEPGVELRQAHDQVLADTGEQAAPAAPEQPELRVPRELPPDINDFTGRGQALAWVAGALATAETAPVHLVLHGPGGVGKSTVAIRAARSLADRFPGGALYVDLLGGGDGPLPPASALASLLRSLLGPHATLPDELADRAQLFRTLLDGRRALVLLDQAHDETQVRPLLAAAPGCATLITSRSGLAGLAAAAAYQLDTLPTKESMTLLAQVAGAQRVAAEPAAAEQIVELCGGLPLAVRIAGARLARRAGWSLGYLAGRLADEHRRLDELAAGDLAVRGSIALGYHGLAEPEQQLFRRLGLLSAPDLAPWTAAVLLAGAEPTPAVETRAEQILETLVDSGLLQPLGVDVAGQPRYRCHDLTRLFAREQSTDEPADPLWRALSRRVLRLSRRARAQLLPAEPGSGETTRLAEPALQVGSRQIREAADWLTAERGLLVATVADLHQAGWHEAAWRLAFYLAPYLASRSQLEEWRRTHELGLAAARAAEHRRGMALMLRGIGDLHRVERRLPEAADALRESLHRLTELGDRAEEARTRCRLGWAELAAAELVGAEVCFEGAVETFVRHNDLRGCADAWRGLAEVQRRRRQLWEAADFLQRSVDGYRQLGDPRGEAETLRELADVQLEQGSPGQARVSVERAAATLRRLGDPLAEARVAVTRARLCLAESDAEAARVAAGHARQIFADHSDQAGLAAVAELGLVDATAPGGAQEQQLAAPD
ncbi:winged helix-turn-helix domain-containing protein [Natronosporangium hydrolyticum]|uniref:Winged helix-turn-helix domain-containing protein n=1 Tax=Natronosporangium hydrolyticum TaxID=2811111 RepID=A0A895YBN0_9ACTN|nr:AfsR/SARP family transcriptional regulator [Natronosporangium hydrolyticum]QSB12863.1 winged helix-turn-helix domain-containing protein [Natronosporangium hydrolyticum]